MVSQLWSPSKSPAPSNLKAGLVPAIRDTGFPTPLVVRIGATSSNTVYATENGFKGGVAWACVLALVLVRARGEGGGPSSSSRYAPC